MISDVLAVDIGGTKLAAALMTNSGQLLYRQVAPTPAHRGALAIVSATIELCCTVINSATADNHTVVAVGVGSAGQINVESGEVAYASDNLPGWSGLPLGRTLSSALQLPVTVDNDVNAMALGELHFGAGRDIEDGLYLTVGTGVGGAVVRNGSIWRGAHWSAGEVCHMLVDIQEKRRCSCGEYGHLEAYTSGPAIASTYAELAGSNSIPDLRVVAERAAAGDAMAITAIQRGGAILGKALAGLANVLDPQAIVIGGGVAEIGSHWWDAIELALRSGGLPAPSQVILRKAALATDAVLVGAGVLALASVPMESQKPASQKPG
jgi:glucokinase